MAEESKNAPASHGYGADVDPYDLQMMERRKQGYGLGTSSGTLKNRLAAFEKKASSSDMDANAIEEIKKKRVGPRAVSKLNISAFEKKNSQGSDAVTPTAAEPKRKVGKLSGRIAAFQKSPEGDMQPTGISKRNNSYGGGRAGGTTKLADRMAAFEKGSNTTSSAGSRVGGTAKLANRRAFGKDTSNTSSAESSVTATGAATPKVSANPIDTTEMGETKQRKEPGNKVVENVGQPTDSPGGENEQQALVLETQPKPGKDDQPKTAAEETNQNPAAESDKPNADVGKEADPASAGVEQDETTRDEVKHEEAEPKIDDIAEADATTPKEEVQSEAPAKEAKKQPTADSATLTVSIEDGQSPEEHDDVEAKIDADATPDEEVQPKRSVEETKYNPAAESDKANLTISIEAGQSSDDLVKEDELAKEAKIDNAAETKPDASPDEEVKSKAAVEEIKQQPATESDKPNQDLMEVQSSEDVTEEEELKKEDSEDKETEAKIDNTTEMKSVAPPTEEEEREAAAKKKRLEAEAERLEQEKMEAEKTRLAKEARIEKERLAAEKAEQDRLERERLIAEKEEREAKALEAEEAERLEQEKIAAREAEKIRLAEEARIEKERLAAEKAEQDRLERERLIAEKEEREAKARLEAEEAERLEQAKEAEKARLVEEARLEKERLDAEKADHERLERERRIAEKEEILRQKEEEEDRLAALEEQRMMEQEALASYAELTIMKADLAPPRELTDDENEALRKILTTQVESHPNYNPLNDGLECEDLVDYAFDMIGDGETVSHVVTEVEFMDFKCFNEEVKERFGKCLTKFLQDLR